MSDLIELLKQDLKDYQSIPFWSWNDKLEAEELKRQIRSMKEAGIGGFFMHARGGLQTEYLGDDWFDVTKVCIDEAKNQNMNAWCYDENGWPSGFAGMKLLDDASNFAHYLTYEIRDSFDINALAVYALEKDRLVRVFSNNEIDNNSRLDNDINNKINSIPNSDYKVNPSEDSDNNSSSSSSNNNNSTILDTDKNTAEKQFYCIYDKTNSSVVDILNKEVVDKFIKLTHEEYYDRLKDDFGNAMVGFFTDEPQYFRWETAYTPVLLNAFPNEYNGENILDNLGALFVDCEQAYEFRFKYWRLMNKLYTNNFAKTIYEWCEKHNCKLTGHSIEESALFMQMWCSAGVMPFYEYEQIPGIDWLGRGISTEIAPRQVSSVAQQLGKKQVLTETFACTGWDVTPKELKRIAEWQYVNGVNLMCQHLYPYSIRGQRKRDYPTFFSEHNPWMAEFKHFNDYFTTLGFMLAESKEAAKIAIIHPMHSAYLTYNRKEDYASIKDLETSFATLIEKFGAANIGHHYIDELLLEKHGSVNGDKLVMGLCEYSAVVVPQMDNLDSSTVKLLKEYVSNGGKIYFEGEIPRFVDGKLTDLSFFESNISYEQLFDEEFEISDKSTEIRSTYRKSKFGDFIYAVNLSENMEYPVDFKIKANSAVLFDLESRKYKKLDFITTTNGITVPMDFKPGQSFVVMLDKNISDINLTTVTDESIKGESAGLIKADESTHCNAGEKYAIVNNISNPLKLDEPYSVNTNMKIVNRTENALTVDNVCISYDNIVYEPPMPVMAASFRLLKEQRNGKIFLRYSFDVSEVPDSIYIEAEKMDVSNVYFNNLPVEMKEMGILDRSFVRLDIRDIVEIGKNEIVFELNYYQSQHVYDVLFNMSEGTESLMNCLSYDTDVEAIYIFGDFNVNSRSGYLCAEKNTYVSDGDFTIVKSTNEIDASNIVAQGNPFFAGEITLEKMIEIQNPVCNLQLTGRYAVAEVYLNGKFVSKLMFDNICDLTVFAKPGENILTIKLINSNRNLFGPFHCKDDYEPYSVWPNLFDMYDTWDNSTSPNYRESYSFVEFGISEICLI